MTTAVFRHRVVSRLHQDLVGPLTETEVLSDRPSQRYSTGILYPRGSQVEIEVTAVGNGPEPEDQLSGTEEKLNEAVKVATEALGR